MYHAELTNCDAAVAADRRRIAGGRDPRAARKLNSPLAHRGSTLPSASSQRQRAHVRIVISIWPRPTNGECRKCDIKQTRCRGTGLSSAPPQSQEHAPMGVSLHAPAKRAPAFCHRTTMLHEGGEDGFGSVWLEVRSRPARHSGIQKAAMRPNSSPSAIKGQFSCILSSVASAFH